MEISADGGKKYPQGGQHHETRDSGHHPEAHHNPPIARRGRNGSGISLGISGFALFGHFIGIA